MKNRQSIFKFSIIILLLAVLSLPAFCASTEPGKPLPETFSPTADTTHTTICSNQLPYHWNNVTCLSAGTYSATLPSGTVFLVLTVINVGTSITNAVVCDNELPYHWNGNSYSTNGTYSVTLTSANGCDSVPILSLTVNHVVTSTTPITICSNQLPYSWNGNNYPAAGTYVVTLTSSAGCDSIATLNLAVKPVKTSTTNTTTCISNLPYNWNGNSYPGAGSYSITLTGSNGCDSIATLILSVSNSVTSTTPVIVCNDELPYSWNGNNYSAAGTYSVNLTSSSGCDSVATLIITVPPVNTSNTAVGVCPAQLPYIWNGNSYSGAGLYAVTITSSSGCDSIARLQLIIVNTFTSTVHRSICSSSLPYTWNGNNYSASGLYTASFVTAAGCDSVATLDLTIIDPHTGSDSMRLCSEQLPYNWHGHIIPGPGLYTFSPPVTISACNLIDTLTIAVVAVIPSTTPVDICGDEVPFLWNGNSYSTSGLYGVQLTSSFGCDSIANLLLAVHPVDTTSLIISVCSNELPYVWNGGLYDSTGVYAFTYTSLNNCDSVSLLDLTVIPVPTDTTRIAICNSQLPYAWNGNSFSSTGIYTITYPQSTGCDSLAVLDLVAAAFLTSTTDLTICDNLLPYSWNGNNYTVAGVYQDTITSSGGCDSIVTLNLTVNPVLTSLTDLTICNSQVPFNWNGTICNGAGSYTSTLISAAGCDSIANLNLTVNTIDTSTTNAAICNNQLPYTWNGNSYPVAGTYPVTLVSSIGCDSIAILNLVVSDILTSTTNVIVCNNQLPYTWNGNNYSVAGTYSVTITNPAGCDSVPILSLSVVLFTTSTTDITVCDNELPYAWNGNNYNSTGSYSVMLSGSSGCDSLATLNFLVNPAATSTTSITICDNQVPYTWNGNNYSITGSYQATLAATNGCDSVATLDLVVNPTLTSTTDTTICINQLPYNWNGNSYSSGGIYSVTLTGANGCDSVAVLNLATSAVVTTTFHASTCDNQVPYTWNGNNYSSTGTYAISLTGSSGCDSIATLDLVVNPTLTSTTDFTTCDNQLPYIWNGNNYTLTGTYTVTLASNAGCDSVATLNLIVNSVASSTTDFTTCENQTPYNWNGQQYNSTGNYSVTLNTATGCDSIANLHLVVNPVQSSTTTASTCSSELPYSWNGQLYNTSGIHVVTLTAVSGCDSVATLDLTIHPTPAIPSANSPVNYCQFENSTALVATGTDQLLWYDSLAGGTGTTTAPVPSTAIAGTFHYYVGQSTVFCQGPRLDIIVTINPTPVLGPDADVRVCYGGYVNLDTIYNTSGLNNNWTLNNLPVTGTDSIITAGLYQLIVSTPIGCADTANVNFNIQPLVVANAGPDANAEYNYPYQLHGSGGSTYQWFPMSPLNNAHISNPLATLTEDTEFILEVQDEIGCRDVDSVLIRVYNGPTFYIPNAFTPNGDGMNDIFRPIPIGIDKLEYFMVFNRYGELVYRTSEIGAGWDGVYKGKKQPIGGYVWKLKGTDRNGKEKFMKGNVVLVR